MIVYLLDFKQYGDRLAKKFDTIDEYDSYVLQSYDKIEFNKNDGIVAKQILNTDTQANYFIVCDDEDDILSRWYITEAKWIRNNQTQYVLYRDLLADYQDIVKNSTCKINRAILDYDDPLIFNSEGINVNQIKKSEALLKDNTSVPWLVAYVDKNTDLKFGDHYYSGQSSVNAKVVDLKYQTASGAIVYPYYGMLPFSKLVDFNGYERPDGYSVTNTAGVMPKDKILNVYTNKAVYPIDTAKTIYKYVYKINSDDFLVSDASLLNPRWLPTQTQYVCYSDINQTLRPDDYNPIAPFDQISTTNPEVPLNMNLNNINGLNGLCENALTGYYNIDNETINKLEETVNGPRTIYVYYDNSTNKPIPQYMEYIVTRKQTSETFDIRPGTGGINDLYDSIYDAMAVNQYRRTEATQYPGTINNYPTLTVYSTIYTITARKVSLFTENSVSKRHTDNGLYDIICTPYMSGTVATDDDGNIQVEKQITLSYYQSLAEYNKDAIYDIQILPYCPIADYRNNLIATDYQLSSFRGYTIPMLNVQFDSTTFDILFNDPMTTNNKTRKQRIITDFYRLCDPGYNGVFEFNSEKNNGITKFNVDMTLKPFSPFIHLNPDFGGLYGQDFNDARGLICGSNFSISTVSNRFAEYEMNNKNWQQMFNRQVQNLEFTQRQERINNIVGAVTGTIQGGAMGASIGMSAGPAGAIAGGIAGTVASGIGGIADLSMMESRQREQMDYMKDMHNYQIDNIKALPDALTRVTTMNNIYKYFPFLEYYSCTDQEKTVVNNWINWYSMTVNAIGTVNSYIKQTETFISATPLRSLLADDSHIDNALQREMEAGFFI